MTDYIKILVGFIGCVVGGFVALEIYKARNKVPKNKITNEAVLLMDEISSTIEKEVQVYITSLEGTVIKLSDIDDIIVEIFFIAKEAIGESVINRINEINLKEIGEEIDIDNWIKNVITHTIKRMLGTN